jgi:glycosyltransferase involved in cell wall biosynthesis
VEKITYACATKIYPNSYGLKQVVLENKYTSAKKLKVIGKGSSNGIDTSFFDPSTQSKTELSELRKSLLISPDDFIFIFVGRLVRDKGITELVAAFDKLSKKYVHSKLLLVGMYEKDLDPLDGKTNMIIEANKNIITTGSQEDVRPYLSISHLLTFPSYREGFPNVVMEAGAMGLPSIVSDINGCNEIIVHGWNGFIVPPKSETALQERMEELLLDQEKLQELAKNARRMILERFERRFIWEELLKEYETLDKSLQKKSAVQV